MPPKKVQTTIKLQLPAGKATPAPPVGTALGPHGLNIMDFCKQFNAKTSKEPDGMIFPVLVTVYTDRSFTFILKTPPASVLLSKLRKSRRSSLSISTPPIWTPPSAQSWARPATWVWKSWKPKESSGEKRSLEKQSKWQS